MTQRHLERPAGNDEARCGSSGRGQSVRHSVMLNGRREIEGIRYYEILVFDGRKQWSLLRRYSDFEALHAALKKSVALPPMPPKSYFLIQCSERFRQRRYTQLGLVLAAAVAQDPSLHRVPELIAFLRRKEFLLGPEGASKSAAGSAPPLGTMASEASTGVLTSNISDGLLGSGFIVGQRVQMKDDSDAFWYSGIITSVEPLEVAMEGDGENGVGHCWNSVRHAVAEGRVLKAVGSAQLLSFASLPSTVEEQLPQGTH